MPSFEDVDQDECIEVTNMGRYRSLVRTLRQGYEDCTGIDIENGTGDIKGFCIQGHAGGFVQATRQCFATQGGRFIPSYRLFCISAASRSQVPPGQSLKAMGVTQERSAGHCIMQISLC